MIVRKALYSRRPGVSRGISRQEWQRLDKIISSDPSSDDLRHVMVRLQEDERERYTGSVTSLSRTTITKEEENVTISRSKREASTVNPDWYRSPCYETTELSTNPSVLNLDNSTGELFFFEGMEQVNQLLLQNVQASAFLS